MVRKGHVEIRLALVMNGGVSLAIWMGGVTQEIDMIRRVGLTPAPIVGPGRSVEDYWRWLCAEFDVEVNVDIVAGTSAGGLNGAVLATAIAAGQPLPTGLRLSWRDDAALTTTAMLPLESGQRSLLDGAFFRQRITRILSDLSQRNVEQSRQVTLFVTATALGGKPVDAIDSTGQRFQFNDHRRRYRFAYNTNRWRYQRVDRDWQLTEGEDSFTNLDRIADAVRASASYPLAFEPVAETSLLPPFDSTGNGSRVWPPVPPSQQPPTWLIDGGVLDNAPFGPVLEEIARRPVDKPYRRIVAYVVPSADLTVPSNSSTPCPPPKPGWLAAPLTGLRLPQEVDFRVDMAQLADLLTTAGESPLRSLFVRVRDFVPGGEESDLSSIAAGLFPEYRRARAIGGVWFVRRLRANRPMNLNLSDTPPVQAESVLADPEPIWLPPTERPLTDLAQPWAWGLTGAANVVLAMFRDVQDYLRKIANGEPVEDELFSDPGDTAEQLSTRLGRIRAYEEEVRRLLADPPDNAQYSDAAISAQINQIFVEHQLRERLAVEVREAATVYAASVNREVNPASVLDSALDAEIMSRTFLAPAVSAPTPPLEFVRIDPSASSPLLPQFDNVHKLYGLRAGHFGAFAEESARLDDWLWGRLDAAARLTRLIAKDDPNVERHVRLIQVRILLEEAVGRVPDGDQLPVKQQVRVRYQRYQQLLADLPKLQEADSALIQGFLNTDTGAKTAYGLATAGLRLLTTPLGTGPLPVQRLVAAVVQESAPTQTSSGLLRLARRAATAPRTALWNTIQHRPDRVGAEVWKATRVKAAAAAGAVVGLAALAGMVIGACIRRSR